MVSSAYAYRINRRAVLRGIGQGLIDFGNPIVGQFIVVDNDWARPTGKIFSFSFIAARRPDAPAHNQKQGEADRKRGDEGRDVRQGDSSGRAESLDSGAHAAMNGFTPALVAAFCNASSSVASGNPPRIASFR